MRKRFLAAAALLALVLLVSFLAGVIAESRGGGGLNRGEQRLRAEALWRAEMIDSLEQDGKGRFMLDGVSCAHKQGDQFECHASASRHYSENGAQQIGRTSSVSESDMLMGIVFCNEKGCSG